MIKKEGVGLYNDLFMSSLNMTCCDIDNEKISVDKMIEKLFFLLKNIKNERNMLFFIGNGGSAGIAVHMTGDYLKNGGIKTHNMFDISTITCLSNDFGYEYVFSKQLEIVAEANDVLIAISSSGISPNILNAVEQMKLKKGKIVTFTGFKKDNKLRSMGNYNIYVPCMEYGIVESIHNMILQRIVDLMIEQAKEN